LAIDFSPQCGKFLSLNKDVTSEGLLVTYPKDSGDIKDSGLSFSQVDETSFECPKCGTKVNTVIG